MTDQKKLAQNAANEFAWVTDLWGMFAPRWIWFLASVLLFMSGAVLYLMSTPAVYTRTASILIKDDSKSGSSSNAMSEFSDLGIFKNNTNIQNELLTLKSPELIAEVVSRLQLNETYTVRQQLKRVDLYKHTPCLLIGAAQTDASFSCTLQPVSAEQCQLTEWSVNGDETDETYTVAFGDSVATSFGTFILTKTPAFTEQWVGRSIRFAKTNPQACADVYAESLVAALSNKEASVITLTINNPSIAKAEDFLNTLIEVYNEKWVQDRNQIAISTSKFISDRLGVIERELGHVDENISNYKSEHLMPDVQAASNLYMSQTVEYKKQLQELNNQLSTAQYIRRELTGKQLSQLLPANSGIASTTLAGQIEEYNKLVLDRNRLVANSSEKNPLVVDMTETLRALKNTLIQTVDNLIRSLNTEMASIRRQSEAATSQLASNPGQAKYLLSVERQQKVKEELYLYLLQKREENELSQAFTAYNTRVINAPRGSMAPTAPQRSKILLIAFVLGLALPAAVIYLMENMDNRVRGRKDLELLTVPLVGEIPFTGDKKKKKDASQHTILVKEGSRDMLNEAFRVMRSNLDFMSGDTTQSQVFITTSFNPGSGKSFLTINMGMSFVLKGKKVMLIDGDMRHGSLSAYAGSPKKGLSNYLSGQAATWQEVTVDHPHNPNLKLIPVGTVPPNPTELLENGKLARLVDALKAEFDYIFIDCPPVDIIADTQIIAQVADRTLFVVRAGLLDRSMLPVLQGMYDDKRFQGMAMILNGTESSRGRYSYRYGYYYGHGNYYSQQ
ncbi:tyrosine-protein kinase ptk [gut metagenome]|uniref:non-specific protein-tyrosine kinase n=1 Tax=gut metagenome TaxID=749906 RepID=J9FGR8_9ZZZZ